MANNAVLNQTQGVASDELLKATALLYFQDALLKSEYEECAELIAVAKQYGATQSDINDTIADYLRNPKALGGHGANLTKTRRR